MQLIVYTSTMTRSAAGHLKSTMEDILVQSVANNRRAGLTGMLFCDGAGFAQALEGPREAVDYRFNRIAADPRHCDVKLRISAPAQCRQFAWWSMCGLTLTDLDDALIGPGDLGFDFGRAHAGAILQHLVGIANRHAGTLDLEHARILRAAGA